MQANASSTPDVRRVYQVTEAVATYRLSKSTIYKLMAAGTLKTVKVGGRRLIPVEAIEALFAGAVNDQRSRKSASDSPA